MSSEPELPIELELKTTKPDVRAQGLPKKVYFGCQIFETLRSSLIMTDCNETRRYFKFPLKNWNQDTIFWEDPDEVNVTEAPDVMSPGPEADFSQFDSEFFANILKKCLLNHPMDTPRHNIVITYPGPPNPARQSNIVSEVRGLKLFPVEPTGVTCISEAMLYHYLFHKDKSAPDHSYEVPIVLYADYQTSWIGANQQTFNFFGEGQGEDSVELCSGRALGKAALAKYFEWRNKEEYAQQCEEFRKLAAEMFDTENPDEFQQKVEEDPNLLSRLADQLPTRLQTETRNDLITYRAFIALRDNLNKVLIERFGSRGYDKLHVICCGPLFTRKDNYLRFHFFKVLPNGCTIGDNTYKLEVKWQCNRSGSLNRIDVAAACYAALRDKVDPLYCETAHIVNRPILRNDLAVVLTEPIPETDDIVA